MVEGHHGLLHPLGWQDTPSPLSVQPEPTMFERLHQHGIDVRSIGPRAYSDSGLTRAVLRGGRYIGADGVGERIGAMVEPRSDPKLRRFTYVYWPDLDRTGHVHGVDSEHWRAELQHVDYLAESVAGTLSEGELLIVTADHGMVDCASSDRVDIDGIPSLHRHVLQIGGEPRCRFVYTRPGHAEEVASAWQESLGDSAWIVTREQAIEAGFFGTVDPSIRTRIGDVIAWAKGKSALVSEQIDPRVSRLRGQHGSITQVEKEIPLVLLQGRG